MRLFLFPISTTRTLIYSKALRKNPSGKQTLVEKLTTKANDTWVKWEEAEKGWQKKVTEWGNILFARIPYQEWGLKSIPPLSKRRKANELQKISEVSVIFPPSIIKPSRVLDALRHLVTERQGLHKKWMWWSVIGLPMTIPFGIIPIVPNLPFFYLVFRAWSHWRALAGSRHVEFLLDNGLIKPEQSVVLQKIYDTGGLPKSQIQKLKRSMEGQNKVTDRETTILTALETSNLLSATSAGATDWPREEKIVVSKDTGKLAALCFELPQIDIEIERALSQVEAKLAQSKEEEKTKEHSAK